ncbi:MAG: LamG domain-containing protein [Planctomycetes bacterium]|nr:LamG domain-containing protein [Planctomycetota bacterium]
MFFAKKFLAIYLAAILCISHCSKADIKSLSGTISLDSNLDNKTEAILNSTGLGIGTTPQSNLHIAGNAIFTTSLSIGDTSISSSNLNVSGTLSYNINSITSSRTLSGNHSTYLVETGGTGNIELFMPSPSAHEGKILTFKKTYSGNTVTLSHVTQLDGIGDLDLGDGAVVSLVSNAKYWYIININQGSSSGTAEIVPPKADTQMSLGFDSDLEDESAYDNDGSFSGNTYAAAATTGVVGKGLDFDGVDDFIEVDHSSSLSLANAGSISLWIKPSSNIASQGTLSGFTEITAPQGTGVNSPGQVSMTLVGNTIKMASAQHDDGNEKYQYGGTGEDFSGLSWTDFTASSGSGKGESTSIAIDSDGDKLYYASFTHQGLSEFVHTTSSNLDFANISTWAETSNPPPDGAGHNDPCFMDMVLVDTKMYIALYLHDGGIEKAYVTSVNLDGSGASWQDITSTLDGGGGAEYSMPAIDSDGEKLYYAFFANNNADEYLYFASSNLDGSDFALTSTITAPDATRKDSPISISMVIAGDTIHYSIYVGNADGAQLFTAYGDKAYTTFSGWTDQGYNYNRDLGIKVSATVDMVTDGKAISILTHSSNVTLGDNLMYATIPLDGGPILSKGDAYALHYTGGGLVFDWAGSPKSFGSLPANTYTHVGITYDGNVMNYYINGSQVRRQTVTADFTLTSDNLLIGGDGVSRYFDGHLDEVKIFGRGLSASEMSDLYLLGQ